MATQIAIENLASWLQNQPENTINTPYELNVTGLTAENYYDLRTALLTGTPRKYVDLSNTILPEVTSLSELFKNTRITKAPAIPNTVIDLSETFSMSSITEASIYSENAIYLYRTFYGCTSLTKVSIDIKNATGWDECCRDCTELVDVKWICPKGSLYYVFLNDIKIQNLEVESNKLGQYSATSNFGTSTGLAQLKTLKIKTKPLNLTGTSKPISNSSGSSSIFGYLPRLESLEVIQDYSEADLSNAPKSIVIVEGAANLKSAKVKYVNPENDCFGTSIFGFQNCTDLEEITFIGLSKEIIFNQQGALTNCSSLMHIYVDIPSFSETQNWHVWRLKYSSTKVQGKVFNPDGSYVTIPQTTITRSDLQLPILTDELWFPTESDSDVDEIIQKMLNYKYGVFKKDVIQPNEKTMVLWADDPDNFLTNLNLGGGCICDTAGSVSAKEASMADYVLRTGNTFQITFKNSNTSETALTLNINGTGAKPLYINNSASSATNYTLNSGTYLCRYNGTNYYIDRAYFVTTARNANNATNATNVKDSTLRQTSANVYSADSSGKMTHFLATSSMTTAKPMADGHIIHLSWDNTGGYASQFYLPTTSMNTRRPQYRGESAGTWSDWINFLTEKYVKIPTSQPSNLEDGMVWIV